MLTLVNVYLSLLSPLLSMLRCIMFMFYFATHFYDLANVIFRMKEKKMMQKRKNFWDCNSRYPTTTHYRMSNISALIFAVVKCIFDGMPICSPTLPAYALQFARLHLICFRSKIRNDNILQLLVFFILFPKICLFVFSSFYTISFSLFRLASLMWHTIMSVTQHYHWYAIVCVR